MTEAMTKALNAQIVKEAYASFLYLSMASWLDQNRLAGAARFMFRQADEEREHMMGIVHYLLEMDAAAVVPEVQQPPSNFDSVKQIFEQAYEHERLVTASINDLVDLSIRENDHATNNFLQWYVEEQREEEALMRTILDRIHLIGEGPQCQYFIDKELEVINDEAEKEEK